VKKKTIKPIRILKKPTGSVLFRFYKPETKKIKPNRIEPKPKKPSQTEPNQKTKSNRKNRAKQKKPVFVPK
jgi:hypothetical protein